MNLEIKWGKPYPISNKYGDQWKREWLIPLKYRPDFFTFWRANSFKCRENGIGIYKKDNDWFVTETKPAIHLFKEFSDQKPKLVQSTFTLVPKPVKNSSGLKPWQVDPVGILCAAIEHWGCAIDGSDLGIGKTYVACAVARELGMDIAIICPKAVMITWNRVICDHFKMKDKLKGIINYESLRRGKKESSIASFVKNRKSHKEEFTWKLPKNTLIVWDESQKLKGAKTQNSETCMTALKQGYKMLFCSATNATNPLELRTVGMSLKLFDNSKQYYTWLYAHGVSKGRFGLEFNGDADVLKKLHKDIFLDRGVRLTRDIIPNFPESQIIADCYDMEDDSKNKINTIYSEMKLELERLKKKSKKGKGDSACALTAIIRARQKIELLKVPLFIDMIEEGIENDMSVVVFVNFTETLNALSERLNTKCIINGIVSDKERQENLDNFQANKERVILINIAAGGAGISCHDIHGKYPRLALISPSYSAVLMRQATGRVWRDGSKSKSIQKIVFVANTVEEEVCESVNRKLTNLDLLNDGDLEI